jgi:hypothetical protein
LAPPEGIEQPDGRWKETGFGVVAVPAWNVRRAVDGDGGVQYRHLDERRRRRLADDDLVALAADGGAGPDGDDAAGVSVRVARRGGTSSISSSRPGSSTFATIVG